MTKFSENRSLLSHSLDYLKLIFNTSWVQLVAVGGWRLERVVGGPDYLQSRVYLASTANLLTLKSFYPCVCTSRSPKDPNAPQSHPVPSSPLQGGARPSLPHGASTNQQFHLKSNSSWMVSLSLSLSLSHTHTHTHTHTHP